MRGVLTFVIHCIYYFKYLQYDYDMQRLANATQTWGSFMKISAKYITNMKTIVPLMDNIIYTLKVKKLFHKKMAAYEEDPRS